MLGPRRKALIAVSVLLAGVILSARLWLSAAGHYLVQAGEPVKAEAVVALAGDYRGNRLRTAGNLVRQGFAPIALISGQTAIFGQCECHFAIDYAVREGYPRSYFEPFEHPGNSTEEEIAFLAKELRRRNIRRILLVTSNYHTRRSGRVARHGLPGVEVHVVAAPDDAFEPDAWWRNREGQKRFFFEATKTIAYSFGL